MHRRSRRRLLHSTNGGDRWMTSDQSSTNVNVHPVCRTSRQRSKGKILRNGTVVENIGAFEDNIGLNVNRKKLNRRNGPMMPMHLTNRNARQVNVKPCLETDQLKSNDDHAVESKYWPESTKDWREWMWLYDLQDKRQNLNTCWINGDAALYVRFGFR